MAINILASGPGGITQSKDGGTTWQLVYNDYEVYNLSCKGDLAYGLVFVPNTTIPGYGKGRIIRSEDGGDTWTMVGSSTPPWSDVYSTNWPYHNTAMRIHLFDNGTLAVINSYDNIYRSDTGPDGPWTPSSYSHSVYGVRDGAVSGSLVISQTNNAYLIIDNYGLGTITSYSKPSISIPPIPPYTYTSSWSYTLDTHYIDSNRVLRVGAAYFYLPDKTLPAITQSFDGGATWPGSMPPGYPVDMVAYPSGYPNDVFLSNTYSIGSCVEVLSSGRILVGTGSGYYDYAIYVPGKIYLSTDDTGAAFTNTLTTPSGYISSIKEYESGVVVAVSAQDGIYKSEDGGETWAQVQAIDEIIWLDLVEASAPPVADFTANILEGYQPLSVQFTDTSTFTSGPIISWLWDFGDGNTSIEQNPSHVYTLPGIWEVKLTVSDGISSDTKITIDYIKVNISSSAQKPLYITVYAKLKTWDFAPAENRLDLRLAVIQGVGETLSYQDSSGIRVYIPASTENPIGSGFSRPQGPILIYD